MNLQKRKVEPKKRPEERRPVPAIEDERGWAGQYGQHAANEEEKSYRPGKENSKTSR